MTTAIGDSMESGRRRAGHPLRAFRDDESGATAIEYGLIVALIFLAIVSAIRAYTGTTSDMYMDISSTLDDAASN